MRTTIRLTQQKRDRSSLGLCLEHTLFHSKSLPFYVAMQNAPSSYDIDVPFLACDHIAYLISSIASPISFHSKLDIYDQPFTTTAAYCHHLSSPSLPFIIISPFPPFVFSLSWEVLCAHPDGFNALVCIITNVNLAGIYTCLMSNHVLLSVCYICPEAVSFPVSW